MAQKSWWKGPVKAEPNFDNLLQVLRREKPDRPTLFEFFMNDPLYRVTLGGQADRLAIVAALQEHGYAVQDLTDNEMAKLHLRHLAWGSTPHPELERVFRFEFPERPGALIRFLTRMSRGWNITLFHYRNHGADVGRVLAGMEVPPEDGPAFDAFLEDLGYPWTDEKANPAYRFLLP